MPTFEGIDFVLTSPLDVKANILAIHGICEYKERYQNLLAELSNHGFKSAIIDNPGHGTHKCTTGLDVKDFIAFQQSFLNYLYKENFFDHTRPLFILGQSMGGLIAAQLSSILLKDNWPIEGVLLLCPAFMPAATTNKGAINKLIFLMEKIFLKQVWLSCEGKSSVFQKLILKPLLKLNPKINSLRSKNAISDLPEVNEQFTSDPKILKTVPVSFLYSILSLMVKESKSQLNFPYMIAFSQNDRIVDSQGSLQFIKRNQKKETDLILQYNNSAHELHNSSLKTELYSEIINWLKLRAAID